MIRLLFALVIVSLSAYFAIRYLNHSDTKLDIESQQAPVIHSPQGARNAVKQYEQDINAVIQQGVERQQQQLEELENRAQDP